VHNSCLSVRGRSIPKPGICSDKILCRHVIEMVFYVQLLSIAGLPTDFMVGHVTDEHF
jgi:hypothetical protein